MAIKDLTSLNSIPLKHDLREEIKETKEAIEDLKKQAKQTYNEDEAWELSRLQTQLNSIKSIIEYKEEQRKKALNKESDQLNYLLQLRKENDAKADAAEQKAIRKLYEQKKIWSQVEFEERMDAINEEFDKRIEIAESINALEAEALKAKKKEKQEAIKEEFKQQKELIKKTAKEQEASDKKLESTKKKKDAYDRLKQVNSLGARLAALPIIPGNKKYREERKRLKQEAIDDLEAEGEGKGARTRHGIGKVLDGLTHALGNFVKQLDSTITTTANMQSQIDTRLYGSNLETKSGSIWKKISSDVTSIAAVSPFVKMSDIVTNIKEMVSKGIAYNVEQRAFLNTIKDKIATTFDANDATLTKLIRIQQQDTTAGRLGMEAALNSFLNSMYQTTEYMTDLAKNIRSDLYEAEALSNAAEATEFEYTVQKWLGSMYSVGANNVQSISKALGQILSGNLEGITSGGAGNLLIMAANRAGLSVSDMLSSGLNSDQTSNLLEQVVNYLGDIYNQSKNSRVIQQQLAQLYGVTASDLKAIASLANDAKAKESISEQLSYDGMVTNLMNMAGSIRNRMNIGEMLENGWDNFKYTLGANIANNPVTYAIYKSAGLLDDVVGGIALPDIKFMGTGVNLRTSVADLMRVAALSGGIMAGFGDIVSGLGSSFDGKAMLNKLGISSNLTTVSRGSGDLGLNQRGSQTSSSGYVGNSSGSDVKNKTLSDADNESSDKLAQTKAENTEVTIEDVNDSVLRIYQLLEDVTNGALTFTVKDDTNSTLSWVRDTIHG